MNFMRDFVHQDALIGWNQTEELVQSEFQRGPTKASQTFWHLKTFTRERWNRLLKDKGNKTTRSSRYNKSLPRPHTLFLQEQQMILSVSDTLKHIQMAKFFFFKIRLGVAFGDFPIQTDTNLLSGSPSCGEGLNPRPRPMMRYGTRSKLIC